MSLPVAGVVDVDVVYRDQKATLPICVVDVTDYAPPLMGWIWFQPITFDWPNLLNNESVKPMSSMSLNTLLSR